MGRALKKKRSNLRKGVTRNTDNLVVNYHIIGKGEVSLWITL